MIRLFLIRALTRVVLYQLPRDAAALAVPEEQLRDLLERGAAVLGKTGLERAELVGRGLLRYRVQTVRRAARSSS